MSIFNTILDKLGIHKPAAKPAAQATSGKPTPAASTVAPRTTNFTPVPLKAAEMPMVDVTSMLDGLAKKSAIELNWRVSINDLMALLGLDHKSEDIKALAVELGCPESEMGDSYKRNVWTHKALLKKIAENGGKIPQNLLD